MGEAFERLRGIHLAALHALEQRSESIAIWSICSGTMQTYSPAETAGG